MKRITAVICLIALALTLAGCGKTNSDPLSEEQSAPAQQEAAPAATPEVQTTPGEEPPLTPGPDDPEAPGPVEEVIPVTEDGPAATPEPAPTDTPAPAAASAPATPAPETLTRDELEAALDGATSFYMDWFYDRSAVIGPAYADASQYPPYETDGSQTAYPASTDSIHTYDELYAAACQYFDPALATELLAQIGAQDKDGQLCVYKSDGLGGPDYICELDVDQERRGVYEFDLEYAMFSDPGRDFDVHITYELKDGRWAFTARNADAISGFFVPLLFAGDLRTEYDLH